MVRTRIPPSPTGALHIGTARTALFNFLFARQKQGKFILRIEDTDKSRSKKEFEDDIKDGLSWLGLAWDEFYRQSERLESHRKHLSLLLEKGSAYYCLHSEDETQGKVHFCEYRERSEQKSLSAEGGVLRRQGIKSQKSKVIRFKTPKDREVIFEDIIRGKVTFNTDAIGDFSLAKDENAPLYNFAVVVDDYEMEITHVIRGEDHISNTPKQILLQEALGFSSPVYAHLPLILGPDRKKLSKRHGADAISEYRAQGYLAEAMINGMAFLGWNPGDNREFFTLEELIKEFSLERIKKGGSIFDIERLKFINRHYLTTLSPEEYAKRVKEYEERHPSSGFSLYMVRSSNTSTIVEAVAEFDPLINFRDDYPLQLLIWKNADNRKTRDALQKMKTIIENLSEEAMNDENVIKKEILAAIEGGGDRGVYLWPLRVALYGKAVSPDPFKGVAILGKHEVMTRITKAIKKLDIG